LQQKLNLQKLNQLKLRLKLRLNLKSKLKNQ
jgi:hypothetical protein